MSKHNILSVFIVTWVVYLVFLHMLGRRKGFRIILLSISHFTPSIVAVIMGIIFLIGGGESIAQFAVGKPNGMLLWAVWAEIFLPLLLLTAVSTLGHLGWAIVAAVKPAWRRWLPIAISGLLMSSFAFYAVGVNMPDA